MPAPAASAAIDAAGGNREELSAISVDDSSSGGPGDLARLQLTPNGPVVVAALSGEIDQSNANSLLKAIAEGVPNTALGLVVDCTDLRYVDSAGVYIIFTLARRLEAHQQRLGVVARPGSHVEQVFRLTEVQQVATMYTARDEAIQGLSPH